MAKKTVVKKNQRQPNRAKRISSVHVKRGSEVFAAIQNSIAYNLHGRYNRHLSKSSQKKLVAYGPWLALGTLIIAAPELMLLANNGRFVSPIGFLEEVLFNRDSWGLLSMILINIICSVYALGDLFEKKRRGWNGVYTALLSNLLYVLYQLITNIAQPAGPILASMGIVFCLFILLDIREYYTA